ncbi:AraC-like ligand-binding domain-containing protein [Streptomyces sp. DW26H14]|uniref:AraC-like ligand-binding domain-containing protein n=1 Tax=Streptomyces sp. DW26H14 TaxID=3435395 RepID=UPI00403DD92C
MRRYESPDSGTGEWTVSGSPEELSGFRSSALCPTTLHPAHGTEELRMRRRVVETESLFMGDVTHLTALETRSAGPVPSDSFHVHICLTGLASTRSDRGTHALAPGGGVAHNPGLRRVSVFWTAGTRLLLVDIERTAVETALTRLLGRPPRERLLVDPRIDTSAGSGRDWARLIRTVTELADTEGGLLDQPLTARPLVESLVNGFLLATSHFASAELRAPSENVRPRALRAAIALIEEQPELPLTVGEIAAQAHVSVRALQNTFRRNLNTSPMKYLQSVRVRRAHTELVRAHPSHASVSEIAHRWGFTHLSRFAEQYKSMYGESPSRTLQSAG